MQRLLIEDLMGSTETYDLIPEMEAFPDLDSDPQDGVLALTVFPRITPDEQRKVLRLNKTLFARITPDERGDERRDERRKVLRDVLREEARHLRYKRKNIFKEKKLGGLREEIIVNMWMPIGDAVLATLGWMGLKFGHIRAYASNWANYPVWRRESIRSFFGYLGRVTAIPADHNDPAEHFKHPEMTAEEAQLMIFNGMADYVNSYLIHPETMLGRIELASGDFMGLKDLSELREGTNDVAWAQHIRQYFGDLQLHPELPKGKTYVVKWEGNRTPNGDATPIGETPTNQGTELGITLEDLKRLKAQGVIGIKFMTYIDSDQPDTLPAIVSEVKAMAERAHEAELLFFPEDLPAKTMNGEAFDTSTREGLRKKALWSARNPILFAKEMRRQGVDLDAYKYTPPFTLDTYPTELAEYEGERIMSDEEVEANIREFLSHTQDWLLMQLSGGSADTAEKARRMIARGAPVVGFFPGRGVWGKAFWDNQMELPKARIEIDLRQGGTRQRFEELQSVLENNMKPFWEHVGFDTDMEPGKDNLIASDWGRLVMDIFEEELHVQDVLKSLKDQEKPDWKAPGFPLGVALFAIGMAISIAGVFGLALVNLLALLQPEMFQSTEASSSGDGIQALFFLMVTPVLGGEKKREARRILARQRQIVQAQSKGRGALVKALSKIVPAGRMIGRRASYAHPETLVGAAERIPSLGNGEQIYATAWLRAYQERQRTQPGLSIEKTVEMQAPPKTGTAVFSSVALNALPGRLEKDTRNAAKVLAAARADREAGINHIVNVTFHNMDEVDEAELADIATWVRNEGGIFLLTGNKVELSWLMKEALEEAGRRGLDATAIQQILAGKQDQGRIIIYSPVPDMFTVAEKMRDRLLSLLSIFTNMGVADEWHEFGPGAVENIVENAEEALEMA